jgi:hypothetical protein
MLDEKTFRGFIVGNHAELATSRSLQPRQIPQLRSHSVLPVDGIDLRLSAIFRVHVHLKIALSKVAFGASV